MKKIKLKQNNQKTFEDGIYEYLRDCRARNLREGTIKHYKDSTKQMMKYIDKNTLIRDMGIEDFQSFIIKLQSSPIIGNQSVYTYARDLKTLLRFFIKQGYMPYVELPLAKADTQPIETYTDSELRRLIKKPVIRNCTFTEYKSWVIVNFLLSTGISDYSRAAEPPVRCGESHLSGLTEPPTLCAFY